jgi:hypothetical protein
MKMTPKVAQVRRRASLRPTDGQDIGLKSTQITADFYIRVGLILVLVHTDQRGPAAAGAAGRLRAGDFTFSFVSQSGPITPL